MQAEQPAPGAQRRLHSLERIVAFAALLAVLCLAAGFAHADAQDDRKRDTDLQRLHSDSGKVFLRSAAALVQDAESGAPILDKRAEAPMPIASITKLMTAMVLLDRRVDLRQRVAISRADIDLIKGTRSRLRTGAMLTRDELLLLALMASENRAAAALARTAPGGTAAFVAAMNAKARALGMTQARFVDPTGLSSQNVASAQDLARMVAAAHRYARIRDYSTRERATVEVYGRAQAFRNTNILVRNPKWDIGLSKTGYINEAGRCLVMHVHLASRDLIVVLLDSWGKYSRIGDANRIRKWLESGVRRGLHG